MAASTTSRGALRITAALMAAVEVGVHAYLAPAHLEEVPYIGALFVASAVLLAAVIVGLWTRLEALAWVGGSAICAGMFVAFLVSRSVGLPDYHEAWTSDNALGLVSLPPELLFLACAVAALRVPAVRRRLPLGVAVG